MFWAWLLRYSSFLITGVVSVVTGYILHRLTTKYVDLIYYYGHVQWVLPPIQPPPAQPQHVGTFSLFLWNNGEAAAKNVRVGHYNFLPAITYFRTCRVKAYKHREAVGQ